jgi:hypothetical protein
LRVSAWLLTTLAAGVTCATPLVSPADGSDAVLALRHDAQRELRLGYRIERPGEPAETVTLGLSTDYHYRMSDSHGLAIVDFRLKRIFRVPNENGGLINDSLYADAWYRGVELDNRGPTSMRF